MSKRENVKEQQADPPNAKLSMMLDYVLEHVLQQLALEGFTDQEISAAAKQATGVTLSPGLIVDGKRGFDADRLVTAGAYLLNVDPIVLWSGALQNWQEDPDGISLPERFGQLRLQRDLTTRYRRGLNKPSRPPKRPRFR